MVEKLITKQQLAEALGVSVRTVENLTRRRKIPVEVLGYRTHRYRLSSVLEALNKLTVRAVGS